MFAEVAVVAVLREQGDSLAALDAAIGSVSSLLRDLDPAVVTGADAVRLTGQLVSLERTVVSARLAMMARAAEGGAFPRGPGVSDGADWAAKTCGVSRTQASMDLTLANRLERMEATRVALAEGRVSARQTAIIAVTEAEAEGSEADMLALALRADLATLSRESDRRRQAAITPAELERRQRKARHLRKRTNYLGMECGSYALMPGEGTAFHAILDAETDRRVRAEKIEANRAMKEGRLVERQSREQHAADALLHMTRGGGKGKAGKAPVVVVGDIRTLLANDDSVGDGCHIVGGGPIPVRRFRQWLEAGDAFIKGVVHDGVDVLHVQHFGRHIPAHLRTALELGEPPLFDGLVCSHPSCGRRYKLELDHLVPFAAGGATSYRNLDGKCRGEHQTKTEADRAAGLLTPRNPDDLGGSGGASGDGPAGDDGPDGDDERGPP